MSDENETKPQDVEDSQDSQSSQDTQSSLDPQASQNPQDPQDPQASGSGTQAKAMFVFDVQGLLVSPDDNDNPGNDPLPVESAGTEVSFTVWNVGTSDGSCQVDIEVDGTWVKNWVSPGVVKHGDSASPPIVDGLGRYPKGRHVFRAYVTPGAGHDDDISNEIEIN